MAVTITVAGVDRTAYWKRDRTNFEVITNGRGKASGIVFDVPVGDSFRPADGMVIVILEDAVVRYRGILLEPEEEELGDRDQNRFVRFDAAASDYNLIADRRIVAATYEATAFEDIVDDIVTNYLTGEGITQTGVESGETIDKLVLNYVTVTEAFNTLSEITGKAWFIDEDKDLNFHALTSVPAPADLDGAIALRDSVKIRPDRQKYRNRQTILAGTDLFPIVAVAQDATEIAARAALEGTSGIYERVTEAGADITSGEVALEYGDDLIARFSEVPKIIELDTRTAGYKAGQSATADFPNNDVDNEPCFIEEVNGYINEELDEVWYAIRATTGDPFGSWMEHFRDAEKTKPPLQISPPSPGEFDLVAIIPGVVIHDPPPGAGEWTQGAESDSALAGGASCFGVTHHTVLSDSYVITLTRGPVATPRQSIMRLFAVDSAGKPSDTASLTIEWDELVASSFKRSVVVSPDNKYAAFVERGSGGADPIIGIVDIQSGSFVGSTTLTGAPDNNSSTEAWWEGDYIYWPDSSGPELYVVDVSSPSAPVLDNTLVTSSDPLTSVVANAAGTALYGTGPASNTVVAIDITDPTAPSEDDTAAVTGSYESLDINDEGTHVGMVARQSSDVFVVARIPVSGATLGTVDEDTVAGTTGVQWEGHAAVWIGDTLAAGKEQPGDSGSNTYTVIVFGMEIGAAATLVETFSFNHGIVGGLGPLQTRRGNRIVQVMDFGECSVVYGQVTYPDVVPLEIERPLRAGFGGTGIGTYAKGDIIYASGVIPTDLRHNGTLGRLPIGTTGQHLISSGGLPVWADDAGGGGGGTANNELLAYLSTELEVNSGTLQEVSGLELALPVGKHVFRAELFIEADAELGHKYVMGGTAVGTAVYQIRTTDDDTGQCSTLISGQLNALHPTATAVGASGMLRGFTEIMGSINVTSSGTLVPMFATLNDP